MKPSVLLNCDFQEDRAQLRAQYSDAVRAAGGVPLAIPAPAAPDEDEIERALDSVHALLLVGGDDYDPGRWGDKRHPLAVAIHPRRDRFDPLLAMKAVEAGIPVLGICGGHQALAIAAGSALVQHVGGDTEISPHAGGSRHRCSIEPGSTLSRALGGTEFEVNSFHHQAVDPDRLGAVLRISAWSGAPVPRCVEAIEAADGSPAIGVQWHPERILEEPAGFPLFRWLVEEGRKRARR